jgi:hypothetical protein
MLFNNSTFDRKRSIINGTDSTGTGIQSAGLVAQLDDVAPTAITENQFGNIRMSSRRALLVEGVASGTPISTKSALTASAPTFASVGVTSAEAVPVNTNRKGLMLVNTSANYISIAFGAAAVLYSGITLNPGGGAWWMDEYCFNTAQIRAIASGAASNLAIQEFV